MRNNSLFLYLAVFTGAILAGVSIYFGSVLPFAKSRGYIAAEQNLGRVKSVPQFIANYDRAVRFQSPVGGEETAKFLGSKILDIVAGLNLAEPDARALAEYADGVLFKDDVRHLMISGHLYNILRGKFKKDEYYTLAEARFRAAHEIGPRLPTPLYALYNLYSEKGLKDKAGEMQNEISRLWPQVRNTPGYFGNE